VDVFVASGSGGLDGPSGLEFHNGDLFVSGRFSKAAYRYDGTTGAYELTIGAGVLDTSYGLTFGPDGNLYVASAGSANQVVRFNPTTGASLGNFTSPSAPGVIGIEFGSDNNLYAASLGGNSIRQYNGSTGAYLSDFVPNGSGGLAQPNFFTFAVPEPGGAALIFAGGLLLLRRRRAS
jgi:WD40 repeat protein